jgi:hypothetical protein
MRYNLARRAARIGGFAGQPDRSKEIRFPYAAPRVAPLCATRTVAKEKLRRKEGETIPLATALVGLPLWQLDIVELTGHNIEARGREEVNQLLREGWRLLHIYTLKYEEEGVWRERPMAILGRVRNELPPAAWRRDE